MRVWNDLAGLSSSRGASNRNDQNEQSLPCRSLVSYPYRWMGILTDAYAIKVPLFKGYREQASIPFVQARIELKVGGLAYFTAGGLTAAAKLMNLHDSLATFGFPSSRKPTGFRKHWEQAWVSTQSWDSFGASSIFSGPIFS